MIPGTDAYVMAYFRGQDTPDGEQIRLAVSRDETPLHWDALDDGEPVLLSRLGEGGVRDPFLFRDHARGVFVLLATDLLTWPDHDWDRAVRAGSRSIVVWESADLLDWSSPRLLTVAPENAGNAWAPKAFWSERDHAWAIIFASALYDPEDDRSVAQHQRLMCALSADFQSATPAKVYSDPGHDVIDATFVTTGDYWYRFSANSHGGTPSLGKHVFQERGAELFAAYWAPVAVDIGRNLMRFAEGPCAFASADGSTSYLLIDDIIDRGYHLLSCTDLDSGAWDEVPGARLPDGARHGSVVTITASEAAELRRRAQGIAGS